jgi:isoleucyl-tRNA synthetase
MDRYILAKTRELIRDVTADLEALDSPMAAAKLRDFADVLTNWYVRRDRDRFWVGDDGSQGWRDAFDTLYTVLETLTRVAAPLIPLVSERIWKGLTGGRSVHLTDWPDAALLPGDDRLVRAMDQVREVASAGLALRKSSGLRVRLPLPELTVVTDSAGGLEEFAEILRDELNVKRLTLRPLASTSLTEFGITERLTVNARAAGPRLGKAVQAAIAAARRGDWQYEGGQRDDTRGDQGVIAGGIELRSGEFELRLEARDPGSAIAFLDGGGFVILATETTPQLRTEGLANDLIRSINQRRRERGLDVSDRITLSFAATDAYRLAFETFQERIAREVLASTVSLLPRDEQVVGPQASPQEWDVVVSAADGGSDGHYAFRIERA